jgi:hypothetical protein
MPAPALLGSGEKSVSAEDAIYSRLQFLQAAGLDGATLRPGVANLSHLTTLDSWEWRHLTGMAPRSIDSGLRDI